MPNATVLPPATINVRVGLANPPMATAISYGGTGRFELKGASDLNIANANDGDAVVYVAATNSFDLKAAATVTNIDGGEY
jgi:hypothetical protein